MTQHAPAARTSRERDVQPSVGSLSTFRENGFCEQGAGGGGSSGGGQAFEQGAQGGQEIDGWFVR